MRQRIESYGVGKFEVNTETVSPITLRRVWRADGTGEERYGSRHGPAAYETTVTRHRRILPSSSSGVQRELAPIHWVRYIRLQRQ